MIDAMQLPAFLFACTLALAAIPSPGPTPFPLGTFQPSGTPTSSPLPEIGRVRSSRPACVAMRELVIPSFAAAQRSDARFAETRVRLPEYARLADDPEHRTDIFRESALAKLDGDADDLLKEALEINKALGDPRLSADSKDPEVMAERKALQQLYDTVRTRANTLTEFVTRQKAAIARNGIDTTAGDAFGGRGQSSPVAAPYQPAPALTAPPGMPVLGGNDLSDREQMREWAGNMNRAVAYSENQAAKVFLPIAQRCK